MKTQRFVRSLVVGAVVAVSTSSFAGPPSSSGGSASGVMTIDQGRAEAGGVTAGDAAGFPITISQPGSYRLMGNLMLTDPNVNAIEITADNVTLDLNGFSIATPVTCSGVGAAFNCSVVGQQGHGIYSINRSYTTVRNGQVRGFRSGVLLGLSAVVEGLTVQHAWVSGITASHNSTIAGNTIALVGVGVDLTGGGVVRNNSISGTRGAGISTSTGSLIVGNRITSAGTLAVGSSGGGVRDNHFHNYGTGAYSASTVSLGDGQSNLCNGVKC
jgi:hypothetical protein